MEKILIGKYRVLEILFTTIIIICLFQSCMHTHNEDIKLTYSKTQQRLLDIMNGYSIHLGNLNLKKIRLRQNIY